MRQKKIEPAGKRAHVQRNVRKVGPPRTRRESQRGIEFSGVIADSLLAAFAPLGRWR